MLQRLLVMKEPRLPRSIQANQSTLSCLLTSSQSTNLRKPVSLNNSMYIEPTEYATCYNLRTVSGKSQG